MIRLVNPSDCEPLWQYGWIRTRNRRFGRAPRRTILTAAILLLLRKHHGIVGYECVIIQKCERKEPR